jgi:pyruvate dehydrogenase (quinone)
MSKRVADVLIETLQAAGVKRCYGIVGDTLNRIAYAIHESEIEWRHEEAGAFAASAEGQFNGELVAPVPAVPAVSTSSMASIKPIAIVRQSS